jgi:hypothetical protein
MVRLGIHGRFCGYFVQFGRQHSQPAASVANYLMLKVEEGTTQLVPVVDEVPRMADAERAALRASLEMASADIESGNFDVSTPQLEFEAVYFEGGTALPGGQQ